MRRHRQSERRLRTDSPLARLNRPELVLRPAALAKRLRAVGGDFGEGTELADLPLPWGQTITVFPDLLGRNILTAGIFDLAATEVMFRLLDRGGLAVDVGANVGYFTNLMATRVGSEGRVVAVEPHPLIFEKLRGNVAAWSDDPGLARIDTRQLALSAEPGTGSLTGNTNLHHMGLASLRDEGESALPGDVEVPVESLDNVIDGVKGEIQLLKVDVEGHEPAVLGGADSLLARGQVRDVLFEDFGTYPTPAMTMLEGHGFTVFTVGHSLLGPWIRPVEEGPARLGWPGPSYLASLEPERALGRLAKRGWQSLRARG